MLYDGNVIAKETNVTLTADSEETLMLEEESRSKMFLKQSDPMRELFDEQALHPIIDQSASSLVKIEAPQELPKKGNRDVNAFVKVNSSIILNDSVNYVEICNKYLELEA
nr:hypothetical protein [Tanacetum cinerariifolium]